MLALANKIKIFPLIWLNNIVKVERAKLDILIFEDFIGSQIIQNYSGEVLLIYSLVNM